MGGERARARYRKEDTLVNPNSAILIIARMYAGNGRSFIS